jgi:predicted dehydrogenase
MALPRKIGLGVIGVGGIGKAHCRSIKQIENAELVAIADIDEPVAGVIGEEFGCEVYTDYHKMLQREDIEIINVATPSGMHGEHSIDAMRAGKHVLSEKPLEITLPKIDQMIAVSKETGMKLSSIFQNRLGDAAQQIHRAAQRNAFGRLIYGEASVKWHRTQEYYDKNGGWRGTWRWDGGGSLMNQSVHYIDLLQWFMGPVKSVRARTAVMNHKIETEDLGVATVEFANGALGAIVGTTSAYPGYSARVDVFGTQGTAIWENGEIKAWNIVGREDAKPPVAGSEAASGTAADPMALSVQGHARQIYLFALAVIEGREPEVTAQDARKAVEIILAIYRSSQTGEPVELPLKA